MKAIVSGATSGIGKAIAVALVNEGWELAVISRDRGRLEQLLLELSSSGEKHIGYVGDLTIENDAKGFVNDIKSQWDFPDMIVNCSGVFEEMSASELSENSINELLQKNFFSAFRLTSPWLSSFKERKAGTILFISSIVAKEPRSSAAAYSLSKNMLNEYATLLADELREFGVKVSRILPGSVNTPSWKDSGIPVDEFVQAEEIAKIVMMLVKLGAGSWMEEITIRPLNRKW